MRDFLAEVFVPLAPVAVAVIIGAMTTWAIMVSQPNLPASTVGACVVLLAIPFCFLGFFTILDRLEP